MKRHPSKVFYYFLTAAVVFIICFTKINIQDFVFFFSKDNFVFYSNLSESRSRIVFWNQNDSPDKFCVWFDYFKASKLSNINNNLITLCTHGSIRYSKFIFDHAKNWDDLISVSLILDAFGFYDLQTFQNLFHCIPEASEKISAHLVWRAEDKRECSKSFILKGLSNLAPNLTPFNCAIMDEKNELFNSTLSKPYPPNSLRNIAREGATTNFHLISDIENHFSENSSKILSISATKYISENDKVAVIVRRFEYNDTFSEPPKNVYELNELMEQKQAFEFHYFTYSIGHKIPELKAWLNYSLTTNSIPSVKTVKYQGSVWEPQLIVHSSFPLHFEGIPIRFCDQQALPYELCRAGYSFAVASHAFSFHKGIKKSSSKEDISARYRVQAAAKNANEKFKKYLDKKYKQIKSNCEDWW